MNTVFEAGEKVILDKGGKQEPGCIK